MNPRGVREERVPGGHGLELTRFTLSHAGVSAQVLAWGAELVSLSIPDRDGRLANVIVPRQLGSTDSAEESGERRFDQVPWSAEIVHDIRGPAVSMTYSSADGDSDGSSDDDSDDRSDMASGVTGDVTLQVRYVLTDAAELHVETEVSCDAATVVDLCERRAFHLSAGVTESIYEHDLMLAASRCWGVTGGDDMPRVIAVQGTATDFTRVRPIGHRLSQLLKVSPGGYDHHFVLDGPGQGLRLAARLSERHSGRVLEVLTTLPALHLDTGKASAGGSVGLDAQPGGVLDDVADDAADSADPLGSRASLSLQAGKRHRHVTLYRFPQPQG